MADDEPDIRLMLRSVLRPRGWVVQEASTGLEALDRCREEGFEAVILDHKMPGLSGAETTQRLRDEGYAVPIILYSAYITDEVAAAARAAGVEAVAKEDLEGLLSALDRILGGS